MEKTEKLLLGTLCFVVAVSIVSLIIQTFVQPIYEMKAFNRFSEQQATYRDAFWNELRVVTILDEAVK